MVLTESHIVSVCKRGQGAATCSYLGFNEDGFFCIKVDPALRAMKNVSDKRRATGSMGAMGDNCEGVA